MCTQPDHLQRLQKLTSIVKQFVRPPVDYEHIATTLWLREFQQERLVSWVEIRNLCYDELRRVRVNEKYLGRTREAIEQSQNRKLIEKPYDILAYIDSLSVIEKKVIYYTYWENLSARQIAIKLSFNVELVLTIRRRALATLKQQAINNEHTIN